MDQRKSIRIALYVLLLTTYVAFSPALENDFVNYDDPVMVTENPVITSLAPAHLLRMWTGYHLYLYHPLVLLSYAVDYQVGGFDPFVYHWTNLVVHLAAVLFAFLIVLKLDGRVAAALAAGLLFGIHPLRVESVAWITERKDVLATAFYLAALLAWLFFLDTGRRKHWYLAFGLCLASLLSKPMAVTFPVVLFLVDWLQRRGWRLREKLPFIALAALFAVVAVVGHFPKGLAAKHPAFTWQTGVTAAGYDLVFYLDKLLIPVNLSCIYEQPETATVLFTFDQRWGPLAAVLLLAAVLWLGRRDRRLGFGVLFFVITLLPVLHLLPVGGAPFPADRYTYLPSLGICYLAGLGFARLREWPGRGRQLVRIAAAAAAVLLTLTMVQLTAERCTAWYNGLSLWIDLLGRYPNGALAWNGRGHALAQEGRLDEALPFYDRALELKPRYPQGLNNRGVALGMLGRYPESIRDLELALQEDPDYFEAWLNLGNARLFAGDPAGARQAFARAAALQPDDPRPGCGYGLVARAEGDTAAALALFNAALAVQPTLASALNGRAGIALAARAWWPAIEDYSRTLQLVPGDAEALGGRGLALVAAGRPADAVRDLDLLVALHPAGAAGWITRGIAYQELGDPATAIASFERALALEPGNRAARQNLAQARRLAAAGGG